VLKAGAYGGGCSSSVSDWALNNPDIDQVWIAHWSLPPEYDPEAEVWNAACVSNSLWADHQRIKQYVGDHAETWGGATITIDSNVFDTHVIGWEPAAPATGLGVAHIDDFGPLGPASGWIQQAGRLFRTEDLGATWQEITPPGFTVLGVGFVDGLTGFAAGWPDGSGRLHLGRTKDGGRAWSINPIGPADDLEVYSVAAAYLEILDDSTLWLAVKLPSGSSFSVGRLFASMDGGATWEERSHPLGEPVVFKNELLGWTVGGPAGVSAFRTEDGGRNWTLADLSTVPAEITQPGPAALPPGTVSVSSLDNEIAWALIQEGDCSGVKGSQTCEQSEILMATLDGGSSWAAVPAND